MGPGIIIPVVALAVIIPVGFTWARRLRDGAATSADDVGASAAGARLTSSALRELPAPPWRIVYEIAPEKLGGVEHVLIGPPGVYALLTTMDAPPVGPTDAPDPHATARAAIVRGELDDALSRCAMSSDLLVTVHWGPTTGGEVATDTVPGAIAVDGRSLRTWTDGLGPASLTQAQVDLAWQTVTTAIGRPDPLA